METFDIAVIGAGIAGASVAYELAGSARVLLVEREASPGQHIRVTVGTGLADDRHDNFDGRFLFGMVNRHRQLLKVGFIEFHCDPV